MGLAAKASDAKVSGDVTRLLAERAARLRYEDIPPEVRALARQCLLDWLAVALAGADAPLSAILRAEALEQGGAPRATLIGGGGRTATLQAALVNGAASHALDYDDVNLAMAGHPSVAVLPGLLALAEAREASGRDLLTAFVAGYETACRIGLLVAPGHYGRGFHATATVGSFGAAAACARLLRLDGEGMATALGIAGTQAAGLKAMFGTMCKPLHAGKAAQNGLLAANLAARGFTARPDLLECAQGFAGTQSRGCNAEAALAEPAGGFHLRANLFKYHAACYLTHAPIECALALRRRIAFLPEQVARVEVTLDAGADTVCNIAAPRTGLEAKFSLRFTVALALAGIDTARLDTFADALVARPDLVALRDKVVVGFEPHWPHTKAAMILTLADGSRLETSHDSGGPASDIVAQGARVEAKYQSLAAPVLGDAGAARLLEAVRRLEDLEGVAAMTALAAAPA